MPDGLAAISAYALVVAVTTLPVLAVIAILLDTARASRGWMFTGAYAVALAAVFTAASFGLSRLPFPRVRGTGVIEIAAGTLLLLIAGGLWLMRRSRTRQGPHAVAAHPPRPATSVTARRAALLGAQFAFHPENLALIFAAAAHVAGYGLPERIAATVWFVLIGVSTVALPTLAFAVAGNRMRDRLGRLRSVILAHSVLLTEVLLAAVGALLLGLGGWRVLSL